MFGHISKTAVKRLGAEKDLICNENVNQKFKMLTLVQPKRNILGFTKYNIINKTLLDLLEEPDFTPEITEEDLADNFTIQRDKCGKASAAAGVEAAQMKTQLSASMDTVDGASTFTLKKKTVDTDELNRLEDKKIKRGLVDRHKLHKGTLTFVYEIVYNTSPVTLYVKAKKGGLLSGAFSKILNVSLSGDKKEETSFTVPKGVTFAYGLMEIKITGYPPVIREIKRYEKGWSISSDGDGDKTLEDLQEEIFMKARLLKPLKELEPESNRHELLKALSEVVRDRDALTLLEETLAEEMTECPQSQGVSSFMALLGEASSKQRDAVHVLVTAMDGLPDGAAALLTACSPETLRVLQQMVTSLMEDGQASLPEPLPVSLQEEGELRWVVDLLCVTDQKLTELRVQWDEAELPPEKLLELVCVVVEGLSLMQP